MKLLQTIITSLLNGTNIASSGSENPVSVVEQTADTLSKRVDDVIRKRESQNPFNYGETGSAVGVMKNRKMAVFLEEEYSRLLRPYMNEMI